MSDQHAFLAPSSAGTWGPGGCAASPRMQAVFPEPDDSQEAREGEAAHWYLGEIVMPGDVAVELGTIAPNGHPVTDEMVDGVQEMAGDIFGVIMQDGVQWCVEQRVHMPQIHPTLNWGRTDLGAVDWANRIIYSWDFKFGHGYVDVFENWQLVDYVVGLANMWSIVIDASWTIDMRIYQPRSFHEDGTRKRVTVNGARFLELQAMLAAAAHEASQPDAPMTTGDYCTHCSANHACVALRRVGGMAVDLSMRGVPHEMSPTNAGLALRIIQRARERLEDMEFGLSAQIMAAVRKGDTTTGWEVYQGYGREKWAHPVDDVVAMGKAFGKDLSKPAEVITPAQARKKGIDEAVISSYSEKPKGEMKLRPLDTKSIRKAFQ